MLLADGLVLISDTRTNAGIDNIAQFRKLHVFEEPGQRVMALATAGNLSISQAVVSLLTEGLKNEETGETETLLRAPSMFQAARLVGRAIREVHKIDGASLEQNGGFNVSMLLGGQIEGRKLRLFMIYTEGNFIESSPDTPFLQIGEHKYGKPILDRAVTYETDLYDGLKLGLISMDSTMRSNLAVGPPLDVVVIRRDALSAELIHRIEIRDPYFENLRRQWSEALRAAHREIPQPPYARRKT
jgi:putative proteasome-type protease